VNTPVSTPPKCKSGCCWRVRPTWFIRGTRREHTSQYTTEV